MRADDWQSWMVREAANETFDKVEQTLDLGNDSFTEMEGIDAAKANISLSLCGAHLEAESVGTLE